MIRPVFKTLLSPPWVEEVNVEVPGTGYISRAELPSHISRWHQLAAEKHGISPILECSTMGTKAVGKSLSAFNLSFDTPKGRRISVESAYQGSKVFANGGPFHHLYNESSRSAKTSPLTKSSGNLVGFNFFGKEFGLVPQNSFFNWLYLSTLVRRYPDIIGHLRTEYAGFTDVFRSSGSDRACQAQAVAMAVGLAKAGKFTEEFISSELFGKIEKAPMKKVELASSTEVGNTWTMNKLEPNMLFVGRTDGYAKNKSGAIHSRIGVVNMQTAVDITHQDYSNIYRAKDPGMNRDKAVAMYAQMLDEGLRNGRFKPENLVKLFGYKLMCVCHPKKCHAHVLANRVNALAGNSVAKKIL